MVRPKKAGEFAMTGLVGSSCGRADPRSSWAVGSTFKKWGGTLSGEGFGFRMARHQ
jgi:hypothetical protein